MCVPSGCGILDVNRNYRELYRYVDATITATLGCSTAESQAESKFGTPGQIGFVSMLAAIAVVVLIATAVDFLVVRPARADRLRPKDSLPMKVLMCFSVPANVDRIMRTGRSKDAIGCVDGMR